MFVHICRGHYFTEFSTLFLPLVTLRHHSENPSIILPYISVTPFLEKKQKISKQKS